jgi:hypothetical protein
VRRVAAGTVLVVSGLVSLTGCQSPQAPEAGEAATSFYGALADGDGAGACAAMTPTTRSELEKSAGKACPEAVLAEDLPMVRGVESSRVYGTMAMVTFAGETTFLTRFPDGWLVTAAGCSAPGSAGVYDCKVKGS